MALVRELLRSNSGNLTVVSYGGADVGMLCAAGKVKKLIFAFVSLDFIPLEPHFRQARQRGDIEVMEVDEGMLLLGLRAAAMRVPFLPTRAGLGTDVLRYNTHIKTIQSPYDDGRDWVAMPALPLDIALIHVHRADTRGVCQIRGPDHYMDDVFARAARQTYVSCEELVDADFFHQHPEESRYVYWERSETDAVAHIPGGAHPSSCVPLYGFDTHHLQEYHACAKDPNGWQHYFDNYVTVNEADYQEKAGGLRSIQSLPLPVY